VFHEGRVRPVKQTSPRYSSTSTSDLYSALKKKQALFQVRSVETFLVFVTDCSVLLFNSMWRLVYWKVCGILISAVTCNMLTAMLLVTQEESAF
jgi:hypothetical protein